MRIIFDTPEERQNACMQLAWDGDYKRVSFVTRERVSWETNGTPAQQVVIWPAHAPVHCD